MDNTQAPAPESYVITTYRYREVGRTVAPR